LAEIGDLGLIEPRQQDVFGTQSLMNNADLYHAEKEKLKMSALTSFSRIQWHA
jgi:hypothetical protein